MNTENDKHGDAHTATYGALPSGPSVTDLEGLVPSATTVDISTSAIRSCLPGLNTCSIMSDHAMRFRYTVHSDDTLLNKTLAKCTSCSRPPIYLLLENYRDSLLEACPNVSNLF
jgi:hypothetical protein